MRSLWFNSFGCGWPRRAFCAFSRLILSGELPDGGEFLNGEDDAADSLKCWASRNWFGVVGSGDFAHYLAGTRVERLRTIKGAFALLSQLWSADFTAKLFCNVEFWLERRPPCPP